MCPSILPIETISEAGFTDWFMPSEVELSLLRESRDLIPNLTFSEGECTNYLSSTLMNTTGFWCPTVMNIESGQFFHHGNVGQLTRPIRQF